MIAAKLAGSVNPAELLSVIASVPSWVSRPSSMAFPLPSGSMLLFLFLHRTKKSAATIRTATPAILPITPPTTIGVGGNPLSSLLSGPACLGNPDVNPGATPVPAAITPPSVGAARNKVELEGDEMISDDDN